MGQAKQRGTFEERKAQAIVEGRTPGWRAREREKSRKFIDELTKKIMAKLFGGKGVPGVSGIGRF